MRAEVRKYADLAALAEAAAGEFARVASEAVSTRGRFSVALSGGSTPRALFELLASDAWTARLPWGEIHVFWADERCVPPDHADSNFGMARDFLLSRVPLCGEKVHRMRGEEDPAAAAMDYENELKHELGPDGALDLILLGMGADGHTASLFPGTPALAESARLVVANYVPSLGSWRLTLTLPCLNAARHVVFLVAGADKSESVTRALAGDADPAPLPPAARVRPRSGKLIWLLDGAAGANVASGQQ